METQDLALLFLCFQMHAQVTLRPMVGHPPPSALFTILSWASKSTQVTFHFSNFLGEVTLSNRLNCFLFHRLSKIRHIFHLLKAMGMPSMQNALQGILRWCISEERHLLQLQEQRREGVSSNWVWGCEPEHVFCKNGDLLYFNLHSITSTL